MTASLEEARRFLSLAGDDFAAYQTLAETAHIRTAIVLPISADALGRLNPYAIDFHYDGHLVSALSKEDVEAMTREIMTWATAMVEEIEAAQ